MVCRSGEHLEGARDAAGNLIEGRTKFGRLISSIVAYLVVSPPIASTDFFISDMPLHLLDGQLPSCPKSTLILVKDGLLCVMYISMTACFPSFPYS